MSLGTTLATEDRRAKRVVAPKSHQPSRLYYGPRLQALAGLLAQGLSFKECAHRSGITVGSAKAMSATIYRVHGISSQLELMTLFLSRGVSAWIRTHGKHLPLEAINELQKITGGVRAESERWLQ